MVSIRKLQQAESEELCTGSLPQDGVITEERAGRCGEEVGRTLEGSGTPKAVTETEERTVNPRGRMKHSHLLKRTCRQEPHCSQWLAPPEADASKQAFQGCHKLGPKTEEGARIPCPIPGPPSAGLRDYSAWVLPQA